MKMNRQQLDEKVKLRLLQKAENTRRDSEEHQRVHEACVVGVCPSCGEDLSHMAVRLFWLIEIPSWPSPSRLKCGQCCERYVYIDGDWAGRWERKLA